jgi:hypothetical protein
VQGAFNPEWEVSDASGQPPVPDPGNPSESLVLQLATGEWVVGAGREGGGRDRRRSFRYLEDGQ